VDSEVKYAKVPRTAQKNHSGVREVTLQRKPALVKRTVYSEGP